MTGRDFNARFTAQKPQVPGRKQPTGRSGGGLSGRDTSHIITPEDSAKKADSNKRDAERLLANYGDMLTPSEKADLTQIVNGGGQPQAGGSLKEGALVALGRIGEAFDRPFQAIRHTVAGVFNPNLNVTVQDYIDIMAGRDDKIVERYGEDVVGKHGDVSGSQMLKMMGIEEQDSFGGKALRFVGAMGIETVLDPMTWFTGGFSGMGKKAALEAMEKSVGVAAKEAVGLAAKEIGRDLIGMAPEQAARHLDEIALKAGTKLDQMVAEKGLSALKEKAISGVLKEQAQEYTERLVKKGLSDEDVKKKVSDWMLDQIDESFGVNRTVDVPGRDAAEGAKFSWDRMTYGVNKEGELVKMESPFNVLVAKDDAYTWYGELMNELSDNIANKTFHNPKKYASWEAYIDHATKKKAPIWTTGGITFGFGGWQKEVPGLTKATRGAWTRVTRPLLEETRRGPAYSRWLKFREKWSREGVQMVMAARRASPEAASYADWAFMRSSQAMSATQSGLISSMHKNVELANGLNHFVKDITGQVPKSEREQVADEIYRAIGSTMSRNDKRVERELFSESLRGVITDEHLAEMNRYGQEFTNLISDSFGRAAAVMPDLKEIATELQAHVPLIIRKEPQEIIGEMLKDGAIPDIARMTDDEVTGYIDGLTALARKKGYLQPGESFTVDHLYHLAALAPSAKGTVNIADALGEKSVLSSRRFLQGAVLAGDTGKASRELAKAFEDQSIWSRQLTGLMKALNDQKGLGHTIDFEDVLELNPTIIAQTYVGQLQEAVIERVGIGAAKKVGRARRRSLAFDAGAVMALSVDHPGREGAYKRLAKFVEDLEEIKKGLLHYQEIYGTTVEVPVAGTMHTIPTVLMEDADFRAKLDELGQRIVKAREAQQRNKGAAPKKVRELMQKSPNMTEREAWQFVADEAAGEVEVLHKQITAKIAETVEEQAEALEGLLRRHTDEIPADVDAKLMAAKHKLYMDAKTELDKMRREYVKAATGKDIEPTNVVLDAANFDEVVSQAIKRDDPETLEALAQLHRDRVESLPAYHPDRMRATAEAAVLDEAAKLKRVISGMDDPPPMSTVEEIWSGMQIGVDRTAVEAGLARGMKTGGFVPVGGRAEDGALSKELLEQAGIQEVTVDTLPWYLAEEKDLEGYPLRTVANIEHTDGTVVVMPGAGIPGEHKGSSGTAKTIGFAMRGRRDGGGQLGFNINYDVADFLEDFEEVPGAPGMWHPKPGRGDPHKPILVVSYQPTATEKVTQGLADETLRVYADTAARQKDYFSKWVRQHDIKKLNMAGQRTAKATPPEMRTLLPSYRYGKTFVMMEDPVTATAVPSFAVIGKARDTRIPLYTTPMTHEVASEYMYQTLLPTLQIKGLKDQPWTRTEIRRMYLDDQRKRLQAELAQLQERSAKSAEERATMLRRKAEAEGRPVAEITAEPLVSGEERAIGMHLDALEELDRRLDYIAIVEAKEGDISAARRPLMQPNPPHRMTPEEAANAARLQLADFWNSDMKTGEPRIEAAGSGRYDPAEFIYANHVDSTYRRTIKYRKDGKVKSLDELRKQLTATVKAANKRRKEAWERRNLKLKIKEGDPEWRPFHPTKVHRSSIRKHAQIIVDAAKETGQELKLADVERELLVERIMERAVPDKAVARVNTSLEMAGKKAPGTGVAPGLPTVEVPIVDRRAAARVYGLFRKYESKLKEFGLHQGLPEKVKLEDLIEDPVRLDDMLSALRQLEQPPPKPMPVLEARQIPEPFVGPTVAPFPVEKKAADLFPYQVERAPGLKVEMADLPPNPFGVAEIEWNPELYGDEIRDIARRNGIEGADTLPLASVGVLPEVDFEGQVGLLQKVRDHKMGNRELRRLAQEKERDSAMQMAKTTIGRRFADDFFDTKPKRVTRMINGKSRVVEEVEYYWPGTTRIAGEDDIRRVETLAESTMDRYAQVVRQAADMKSPEDGDRWLVETLGVDPHDLEAARYVGGGPIDEVAERDPQEILRSWLADNHQDKLFEYNTAVEGGYSGSLGEWLAGQEDGKYQQWFAADMRKRQLQDERIQAIGDPHERHAAFAAELEERKPPGATLEWEKQEWDRFYAAEARRKIAASNEAKITAGAEVGTESVLPSVGGAPTSERQKWLHDAWEAVMRGENADQEESLALSEFFNSEFYESPERAELRFADPAAAIEADRQLDSRIHMPRNQTPVEASDISEEYFDSSLDFEDIAGGSFDGSGSQRASFWRETVGMDDVDEPFIAAEMQQGRMLHEAQEIYGTEVRRRDLLFTQDGTVHLPKMRDPENFEFRSADYVPPTYGVDQTTRPPSVDPFGDPGVGVRVPPVSAENGGFRLSQSIPEARGKHLPKDFREMREQARLRAPERDPRAARPLSDAPVSRTPLEERIAGRTPEEMEQARLQQVAERALEAERRFAGDSRAQRPLSSDTRWQDVEYETDIFDIDPGTNKARRKPTGYEVRNDFVRDELLQTGKGFKVQDVDIDEITRRIVGWASEKNPVPTDILKLELLDSAMKHHAELLFTQHQQAVDLMKIQSVVDAAMDLGIDAHDATRSWDMFRNTGNMAHLDHNAWQYLAFTQMMADGTAGSGEIALDQFTRLSKEMSQDGVKRGRELIENRQRQMVMEGMEEAAPENVAKVAEFVVGEKKVSKKAIREKFGLKDKEAERILGELEERGIVSAKTARGRRSLTGDEDAIRRLKGSAAAQAPLPGFVMLTEDEKTLMKTITGEEVGMVSEDSLATMLVTKERQLAEAKAEWERLRKIHSPERAEKIRQATGQPKYEKKGKGTVATGLTTYRQLKGDMLENLDKADAIVVTTNGYIDKDGKATMGRGIAYEVGKKYPEIPYQLAEHIRTNGNRVGIIGEIKGVPVIAMPVKPVYGDPKNWVSSMDRIVWKGQSPGFGVRADPAIIERSTDELIALVDQMGYRNVLTPRPGTGAGELEVDGMMHALNGRLDDRFIVSDRKSFWDPIKGRETTTGYGGVREGKPYGERGFVVGLESWGGEKGPRSGKTFENPFHGQPGQKEKYKAWLWEQMQGDPNYALDVKGLKGKHLVCPGKRGHPDCHAGTLAEAVGWAQDNVDDAGNIVGSTPAQPAQTPKPIKVEPTPTGGSKLAAATDKKTALENQVRRLKDLTDRVERETGTELVPQPDYKNRIFGPSPNAARPAQSIQGFSFKHPDNLEHLPYPKGRTLNAGRSKDQSLNFLDLPQGWAGNPFVVASTPEQIKQFNKRWAGKRHPMFKSKYVKKVVDGEEQWVNEFAMPYQMVSSADEAAARYHELLWQWAEANPVEARRIASEIAKQTPNIYVIEGAAAGSFASDSVVLSEFLSMVEGGAETNPGNRWAAVLSQDLVDNKELYDQVNGLAWALKRDAAVDNERVSRVVDNALNEVANTEVVHDKSLAEKATEILEASDRKEATAVSRWITQSQQFDKFMSLAYGEDVRVRASVTPDGNPLIQVTRPGSREAGVKSLDEKGLGEVLDRMMLDPADDNFISVDDAIKEMGGEIELLHEAHVKMVEARKTYEQARSHPKVPAHVKPKDEMVAAAQVAVDDYENLMRLLWKSLHNRDPEEMLDFVFRNIEEGVLSDEYSRMVKILREQDSNLADHLEEMISLAAVSNHPMSDERWTAMIHEAMGSMQNQTTRHTSAMIADNMTGVADEIDKFVQAEMLAAASRANVPSLSGKEIEQFVGTIDTILAEGYAALRMATTFDEPTQKLVDEFSGPMKRMWDRFQKMEDTSASDYLPGTANTPTTWNEVREWLRKISGTHKFTSALDYASAGVEGQYSMGVRANMKALEDEIGNMLSNPQAYTAEFAGMVEAGDVGLSGSYAANYMIDRALGTELAQAVAMSKRATSDANLRHLLAASQSVWGWWKRAATIARPSFHIRNFIGGMYNNMLIGVNPKSYFDLGPDVMKYQYYMQKALPAIESLGEDGDEMFFKDVLTHIQPENRALFYNVWKQGILETAFSKGDLGHMPGRTWINPLKANWVPYKVGGQTMEGVEGLLRVAAFNKYFDAEMPYLSGAYAKEMVNTVHFDYVNLTPMEESIKKFVPFFVWSRRNIPLQIRMMLQNPRYMIGVNRAKRLWNEQFEDDETGQTSDLGFITPFGRSNDLGWAKLMWSPDLPMMDVFDAPLFQGRQIGNTPFGQDAKNPQAWALYALELAGPAATIPHDLLDESDRTTNAPAGINEMLMLWNGLRGKDERVSASSDVKIPWFMNSFLDTAVPFYHDYRAALGMQANNPYRAAREGVLPGEQERVSYPGQDPMLGAMRTFGRGFGLQWATPMDEFFANRELERMIDEITMRVRTQLPDANMPQVAELQAAQQAG